MMMRWIMDVLRGNVREARKYATKAHELRDKNRQAADWCCDMADAHLKFNDSGMSMAQNCMARMADDGVDAAMVPGARMVYEADLGDVAKDTADVRALLEAYKRR